MEVSLYTWQREAVNKLENGKILCGGVGSGKSRTALAYFWEKECGGNLSDIEKVPPYPSDLYIITTARKRDTADWSMECAPFMLEQKAIDSKFPISVNVDSWNNIAKYEKVQHAFFIFDEQRVVGSGSWVKSFLKITKENRWILLSATPGDVWMDYVPVFIANGFYKNRTSFIREHVVYARFLKYPKIERYLGIKRLNRLRDRVLVTMDYERKARPHIISIEAPYDKNMSERVLRERWDPYKFEPVRDAGALCFVLRRIVNTDPGRMDKCMELIRKAGKSIVFYNFNYERDMLRKSLSDAKIAFAEWNGEKHEPLPEGDKWVYLVQYTAGAEGWNCIATDTIIFYSLNYSYKIMAQAQGRIDRLNSPYTDLYYYRLRSKSRIDQAIEHALRSKKNFNESAFERQAMEDL